MQNIKFLPLFILFLFLSLQESVAQKTVKKDSLSKDSLKKDTTKKAKKSTFTERITYSADTIDFLMEGEQKVNLRNNSQVLYTTMDMKANIINFGMKDSKVFARGGAKDSLGQVIGIPTFTDKDGTFEADSLTYNIKTKKGLTYGVITQQGEGYLHGAVMKKHEDGYIHIADGKYTTCNYEHPHYYIELTKAKVKPNDKIVSGPLYFVIADIPTPICLPFGYFPNNGKYSAGIIIPSYGEEDARGFYLQKGGYYFILGQHMDLSLTGDLYTEGSWGIQAVSRYRNKYKFSGDFDLAYSKNILGEQGTSTESISKSYQIKWNHTQDPKACPTRTFSASVNILSSNYQKYNATNSQDYLTNTFGSSVSYSKRWAGSPFNFSTNLRHSQNTTTKMVSLTLPSMTFSMERQYPAELIRNWTGKEAGETEQKWYDKINFSYNASAENSVSAADSILFTRNAEWKNGFYHTIPLNASYKFLNYFNITPAINYYGALSTSRSYKHYEKEYIKNGDTLTDQVITDKINQIGYAQAVDPNISLSFSPKFFGMYGFRNPDAHNIQAVRHAITTSITATYHPKLGNADKYADYYYDANGKSQRYLIYENSAYQVPSVGAESASINFNLNNNIEMKVKNEGDTASKYKKITLLDQLSISTAYNVFASSFKWSMISISGSTRLFNNFFNISGSSTFDPYTVDSVGTRKDKLLIYDKNKLASFVSANASLSFSLNSDNIFGKKGDPKDNKGENKEEQIPHNPNAFINPWFGKDGLEYVNFKMPWQLSVSYVWNYARSTFNTEEQKFSYKATQTLNFSGNFSMTEKWKVGFSSGYDFNAAAISYTSANLYRDLHCWEMKISWIPYGARKSYNFQINIKSSTFKDMKYKKEKTQYENTSW